MEPSTSRTSRGALDDWSIHTRRSLSAIGDNSPPPFPEGAMSSSRQKRSPLAKHCGARREGAGPIRARGVFGRSSCRTVGGEPTTWPEKWSALSLASVSPGESEAAVPLPGSTISAGIEPLRPSAALSLSADGVGGWLLARRGTTTPNFRVSLFSLEQGQGYGVSGLGCFLFYFISFSVLFLICTCISCHCCMYILSPSWGLLLKEVK